MSDDATGANPMTPPTNPHAELVEALRPTNGWTYIEKDRWRCTKCAGPVLSMCGPPSILSHFADCPIRLALEYTPPPAPKLTPLPKYSASVVTHSDWVRNNYEALKHQQENTVKTKSEPAFALQERSIESKVNWLIEKVGLLTGLQSNVGSRLDALESNIKHHESGIDEYGNPLTDTFADRLRHLERKVFQLETEQSQRLGSLLEARDKQDAKPKPACDKCGDTKIISQGDDTHGYMRIIGQRLCPCVKVGDVVSAEVANLLPVGSRVECNKCKCNPGDYHEKTNERWPWVNYVLGQRSGQFDKWPSHGIEEVTITRIGPAPATTDVPDKAESPIEMHINTRGCGEPLNTKTIEALGEMGRAALGIHTNGQQPDKAEEIAREICECGDMDSDSWTKFAAGVLRKHHVGQPTPLADLIADPRLRPYWDVIKAAVTCRSPMSSGCDISVHVDALPPELRAAIEGVK